MDEAALAAALGSAHELPDIKIKLADVERHFRMHPESLAVSTREAEAGTQRAADALVYPSLV